MTVCVYVTVGVGVCVSSGGVNVGSGLASVFVGVGVMPMHAPALTEISTCCPSCLYPSDATLVITPGASKNVMFGLVNLQTITS